MKRKTPVLFSTKKKKKKEKKRKGRKRKEKKKKKNQSPTIPFLFLYENYFLIFVATKQKTLTATFYYVVKNQKKYGLLVVIWVQIF